MPTGSNPPGGGEERAGTLDRMEPSRDAIYEALGNVIDPELRKPVTELDMVRDLRIEGGDVAVTIALTVAGCPLRTAFQDQVDRELLPLEGVESVEPHMVFSPPWSPDRMSEDAKFALGF